MAHWFAEVDEWGIPDWQDPLQYGSTGDWDLNRWRWEFTRRRADYRADFEAALARVSEPSALPPDTTPEDAQWFHGLRAWPFFHKGAAKYGLEEFYDPVLSDWLHRGPEWNSGLIYGPSHRHTYEVGKDGDFVEVEADYMVSLSFDLRKPLKAQLAEAQKELEESQGHWLLYGNGREELYPVGEEEAFLRTPEGQISAPKLHPGKWLTYLRALDARAAGASLSEIAEIVLPRHIARRDAKAAHNVLAQAEAQAFRF